MAEQASAPSPSFSGIDFNPAFFPSAANDFVEYPVAQGTVTFGQIYATDLDTPTPSVDFDLLTSETGNINIGTSVPSLKTIKIGASTGTSIHTGSIDHQGTNINNAVSATTGTISLAPAQTTGILNIGSHPSTGTRTTGPINIGSNSIGVTPITIGTTGQSTIALNGTSVDVGTKLTTPKIDSLSASGNIEIGSNQTDGIINIGTPNTRTSGAINIGTGMTTANAIKIGTAATTTMTLQALTVNATTKLTCPAIDTLSSGTNMTIGALQTTGTLTIGGGARTTAGTISIGNGSGATANPIVIGGAGSTVSIGNTLAVATSLKSPILDCITDAGAGFTSLSIGASATSGNIVIGAALGVGDVTIGGTQSSGGTITLGSSNTVTTLPGTLTTSLGTIAGKTAQIDVDTTSLPASMLTTVNLEVSITIFGSAVSGIYTIPSGLPTLQKLYIRNWTDASQTIAFTTNLYYAYGITSSASSATILAGASLSVQLLSSKWFQFNPSGILALTSALTLPTTSYTPTITQLGYTSSVTNSSAISISAPSTLSNFLGTGVNLPKGICLMTFVCTATFTPASNASSMTMSFNESSGVTLTSLTADTSLIMVGNTTKTTFMFTSIMVNTNYAGLGEITWQVTPSATTTNVSVIIGDAKIAWVKIA